MYRITILIALLVLVIAAGSSPQLIIAIEHPDGTLQELASRAVSCSAPPPINLEARFGSAQECRSLCEQGPESDGIYAFHVGIEPELSCSGPRGEIGILGTGSLERSGIASFCTDDTCIDRVDYCDCIAPEITIEADDRWYSMPFDVRINASDNHELVRFGTSNQETYCANCTLNETVPIGSICTQSGPEACTLRATAYDRSKNNRSVIAFYNVDLEAPEASHSWSSTGYWQREEVGIIIEAFEPADRSGVSAIYLEARTEPGCSEKGENYTRYSGTRIERTISSDPSVVFCYYAADHAIPENTGAITRTEERRIDSEAPTITIDPNDTLFAQNTTILLSCSDTGSGCRELRAGLVNDTCPQPAGLRPAQSIVADCPEGAVCTSTLCAWAQDSVGYTGELEQRIMIDRSPPMIRITSLSRDENLTVELLISDDGSGLEVCTASQGDIGCFGNVFETIITIPCITGCELSVSATDLAGNAATLEEEWI